MEGVLLGDPPERRLGIMVIMVISAVRSAPPPGPAVRTADSPESPSWLCDALNPPAFFLHSSSSSHFFFPLSSTFFPLSAAAVQSPAGLRTLSLRAAHQQGFGRFPRNEPLSALSAALRSCSPSE